VADEEVLTNRLVYEARDETGAIYGSLGPLDWYRFRQTLKLVPTNTRSLLDCGCDRGQWLHYILQRRRIERHLGIDVAEARVSEARSLHPELSLSVAYLESLDRNQERFDVVTALEVLEHIPRWQDVLENILRWAERRVIITVPYRQKVVMHVCIHCGRPTPPSGHLHSFSEETFPAVPGWRRWYNYIKDRGVEEPDWVRRAYRWMRPRTIWLAAIYDRGELVPPSAPDCSPPADGR